MRLKTLKSALILISVISIAVCNAVASYAMDETDCTSEKYLLDHGHSKEIVRMINLQKSRIEENGVVAQKPNNKVVKFLKNLWFEQDVTMPLTDFGTSDIKMVETDKSYVLTKTQEAAKKIQEKIQQEKEKDLVDKDKNTKDLVNTNADKDKSKDKEPLVNSKNVKVSKDIKDAVKKEPAATDIKLKDTK